MRKAKKLLALAMVSTMAATSILACGSKDGEKNNETSQANNESKDTQNEASNSEGEVKTVDLLVWSPAEDQSNGLLEKWCEEFDEAHPEWEINFTYGVCSEADAKTTILNDPTVAADVFMFANDQIPELVNAGAIAKIGGKTAEAVKTDNNDVIYNSVVYEDGVYGVPYAPNTCFLYYDKSIFTEDDVKSLNTMLEKDLPDGTAAFSCEITNSWHIETFYYAGGMELFGPDGLDGTAGTNAGELSFVTDYLVDLMSNPKFHVESGDDSISMFKEGKLGAFISGDWKADAIKEALGDNFATAQLPSITFDNGTTGDMKFFAGSKAVGVNPNSENMDVAVALAAYLGSESVQKDRFETRGIVPTNVTLAESDEVKADPIASAIAAVVANTSKTQPMVKEMSNWWSPAESMGKEIKNGTVTKDNSVEKTKQMGDAISTGSGL